MRRIDLHCYPGTDVWLAAQASLVDGTSRFWSKQFTARSEDEVVETIKEAGVEAVLVAYDIESLTGDPPCSSAYVAGLRDRHPEVFLQAWGVVDPSKGAAAVAEAQAISNEYGVLGFHLYPVVGRYSVDDPSFGPLFETLTNLKLPVLVNVGMSGFGAGRPGGMGVTLERSHPMTIDRLAANFPSLTIIAAHPGWPWIDEMTAVALHKGNVFWELSGWAPKYFPPSLRTDIRTRLRDKIMYGSGHPAMSHERSLREWAELGFNEDVMHSVFHVNAERLLSL